MSDAVRYDLMLFAPNQPAGSATLTLSAADGTPLPAFRGPAPESAVPTGDITVSVVPMKAALTLEGGAPIPLTGFALVSLLGPVYCFKFVNAEAGPDWAVDFSLLDSPGTGIGGSGTTSSPALGANWAFLGYRG
ncbi:hypothetical protein [Azospirillum sp. ST 5-10]|uniref:hypothetical protein n=1 Tax=unclassified Azospirillum TaxID=2630922 RepID=UPI003F4A30EF